jgi:cobalt-zinc-cadmium efflux system membrane fusion protein
MKRTRSVALVLMLALAWSAAPDAPPAHAADGAAGVESQQGSGAATRLRCNEHDTFEDECFICHPELRDKGRLWCKEHGRYEDRCFLCHPELRDASRPFCEKHFLYKDECHLCDPKLEKKSEPSPQGGLQQPDAEKSAAQGGAAPAKLMCKEHGVPEEECGICHPDLARELAPGQGLKVRLASPEAAKKAGIETARPKTGEVRDGVSCYAEIVFNNNKFAEISLPVSGIIRTVSADLGDQVAAGTVLATVSSAEIGEALNAALLAQQTVTRERRLYTQQITAKKELEEAEAASRTANQQLRALGFDDRQIAELGAKTAGAGVLEARAPFAGEIVERSAVQGSLAEAGKPLFVVADRSTMWAMLNVPEGELGRVKTGQTVELTLDSAPERVFVGTLTWVAPRVDEHTRMAKARVEIPNPDLMLRADAFAHARIITDSAANAVVVPQSAIQDVDGTPLTFVKLADDLFEARSVRLGAKQGKDVEITYGLRADDEVVVANSFLVKSQLQISRLGAGCTDH